MKPDHRVYKPKVKSFLLDTNVIINASFFKGSPSYLLVTESQSNGYQLYYCDTSIREIFTILSKSVLKQKSLDIIGHINKVLSINKVILLNNSTSDSNPDVNVKGNKDKIIYLTAIKYGLWVCSNDKNDFYKSRSNEFDVYSPDDLIPFLGQTNLEYTIPYFKSTQANWSLFCDIEFVENSNEFNIAKLKCIIDVENWFSMYFDPINQSLLLYFESGSQYNVPMKFRANENFRIVVSYNSKELLIYTSAAQKKFNLSKPLISKERRTTHFVSNRDKTSYLDGVFLKRIFMVPKAYNHKECINLVTSKVSTNPLERMDFREKLDIISKII